MRLRRDDPTTTVNQEAGTIRQIPKRSWDQGGVEATSWAAHKQRCPFCDDLANFEARLDGAVFPICQDCVWERRWRPCYEGRQWKVEIADKEIYPTITPEEETLAAIQEG